MILLFITIEKNSDLKLKESQLFKLNFTAPLTIRNENLQMVFSRKKALNTIDIEHITYTLSIA